MADELLNENIYIEYYENGNMKIESTMIDGKFNGIYKKYHENGKIKIESFMLDGKFNGIYKEYFQNGKIKIESFMIDDHKFDYNIQYTHHPIYHYIITSFNNITIFIIFFILYYSLCYYY
jgi:antitoxin component YwqK of YwqJK toxin-antitoxin module